jgi:protein-disulfide isomerase
MSRPPVKPAASSSKKKPVKKPMSPRAAQFIAIGVALAFVAAIALIVVASLGGGNQTDALPEVTPDGEAQVQRDDSHFINGSADSDVTIVEFLDFQCPACAVAAGSVGSIIDTYGDRVAVVIRNFPLTSIHPHAVDSALAFEAAAAQGAATEMYRALFATQEQWSPGRGSQAAVFRDLAEQLGLDMAEYDRVVADPATLERVSRDNADALGLGLQGTPSFFIDGQQAAIQSLDELQAIVAQKLGE